MEVDEGIEHADDGREAWPRIEAYGSRWARFEEDELAGLISAIDEGLIGGLGDRLRGEISAEQQRRRG